MGCCVRDTGSLRHGFKADGGWLRGQPPAAEAPPGGRLLASPVIVAGGAPLTIEYLRTAQGEVRSEAGAVPQL
jgi:hypothetical protein